MAPLGVALVTSALAFFLAPTASHTQAPTLASFDGRYVLGADRHELHGMEQAIDRVVDQMNLFIREIARGEIHRRISAEQRIHLDITGEDAMSIALDDWGPIEVDVNGRPRQVRGAAGDDVRFSVRYQDGRLTAHTASPRGSRTNVFTLSPDASRLQMSVRITSDQLPADIRYRLTYHRAD